MSTTDSGFDGKQHAFSKNQPRKLIDNDFSELIVFSFPGTVRQGAQRSGCSSDASRRCSPKRTHENLAPWRVKRAKELMISLMAQGCSIERVANECSISRSHFSRAFKNATGLAPHDWLRQEKILRAEELLKTRRLPISRVAQECGFSDQSYFTRVFTQSKGVSPRRWQNQYCPITANDGK